MFLPLHDENPLRVVPYQFVTIAIIVISTGVYGWQLQIAQEPLATSLFLSYGMTPAVLFNYESLPPEMIYIPAEATLLSYMFFHLDVWHLLGNMLFLWVFGDNVEDSMGHFRFAVFYLTCGIAAGFTHGVVDPDSPVPIIGASGAVAGVLGAYLMLHPRVKILVLLFKGIPLRVPAYLLLIGWLLWQVLNVYFSDALVAWWAHIGGFIVGALLIVPLRDRTIPLFDRGIRH